MSAARWKALCCTYRNRRGRCFSTASVWTVAKTGSREMRYNVPRTARVEHREATPHETYLVAAASQA